MHILRSSLFNSLAKYSKSRISVGVISSLLGLTVLIMAPYIHFGIAYSYWNSEKEPVDRGKCQCTCWDTQFKGSYQKKAPGYKHMYFNITSQMLKIWILTIIGAIVAYEVVKHLFILFISNRLRYRMCLLFVSVFYSHYYSWWGYVNAYNDDFYDQWYHQAVFSITEMISTIAVVHLCSLDNNVKPRHLLIITSIAVFHILASGVDQFIDNVLRGNGKWHQFTRDLGFMIPDIMHIVVSIIMFVEHVRSTSHDKTMLSVSECMTALVMVIIMSTVCSKL